jgi:hypothetical protein
MRLVRCKQVLTRRIEILLVQAMVLGFQTIYTTITNLLEIDE